jgi:hypothetical protein
MDIRSSPTMIAGDSQLDLLFWEASVLVTLLQILLNSCWTPGALGVRRTTGPNRAAHDELIEPI